MTDKLQTLPLIALMTIHNRLVDIISDGLTTQASSPNGLITDTCFSLVNQRRYLIDYTDNNS